MQYLGAISNMAEWSWLISRQTFQEHSNPSLYPNNSHWRSWSWTIQWITPKPSRTPKKWCDFHHRWLESKIRKSRDTWSKKQVWTWSTKWSRTKTNRVLQHTGHRKHPLPTTQEMTLHVDIIRWSTLKSDWLYSLQLKVEKLYTVSKTRPGADCSSGHGLLTPKLRIKLKRVGKTTRILRVLMCTQWLQSCPTLFDTVECSFPSSSVHGILQARILEWVALLQGIFPAQGSNPHIQWLLHCRKILYCWATVEAQAIQVWTRSSPFTPITKKSWLWFRWWTPYSKTQD